MSTAKAIMALHAPGLGPALLGAGLRERLAAAGADSLQVNLDDADVAPAMRFGPGTPITAVVSVWSETTVEDAVAAVRQVDPTADAWLVEERIPLPPPELPDGTRADALANVAFLRRPASMRPDEWREDWLGRHTTVAIETQATFGYVQNPVLEALTEGSPPVAGIVEELFPMAAMTDLHAFYGSGGDDEELQRRMSRMMASVERFGAAQDLDLVPTSRYAFDLTGVHA